MAGIPQISNPAAGRGFNTTSGTSQRNSGSGSGDFFDIIQIEKPVSIEKASEREGEGNSSLFSEQKEFLQMSVKIAKNPTMAIEALKQIMNNDLLSVAKANGYTELYGELDTMMKTIFIAPEDLFEEIQAQERENTMFKGNGFFETLRTIAHQAKAEGNEDLLNAIGNMLKAVNYAQNKDEILTAISYNMKFLSQYFAPNKMLSEELGKLSGQWGLSDAENNFESLKINTLSLLQNVSESLLNNDRTQVLIPLIVHNLSRYNTNKEMLFDYFELMVSYVYNEETRENLISEFEKLLEQIFSANTKEENANQPQNNTSYYNNTTNREINQPLNENLVKENSKTDFFEYFKDMVLDDAFDLNTEEMNIPVRSYLLGKSDGKTAIAEILRKIILPDDINRIVQNDIRQISDIGTLVDYLNDFLKIIPDIGERQYLYESLLEIVNVMVGKNELPIEPYRQEKDIAGSVIKELINFVEKNIDHPALKTINNYNASNLLQSLINAPGVFTPLTHYIIPLAVEETRTFGELWVNNDEEEPSPIGGTPKKRCHLFLTFDIDTIGRFEVNMLAVDKTVNISLLHPNGFSERVDPIIKKVSRIIASTGYQTGTFTTAPLKKPHDLTEIFPDITKRREGFDVTA